jgi:hypothetical protein
MENPQKIKEKSEKCKPKFVGLFVRNTTIFVKHDHMPIVFPDSICMKNRRLINLDLLYVQIYMSSVAEFWICCVLCYA